MDALLAMRAFAALSQATRLGAFQLLVAHEPLGLPAGQLAEELGVPANTLSVHLRLLQEAGLVTSRRASRQIIYRAHIKQVGSVANFLSKNCCKANGKTCKPQRKA